MKAPQARGFFSYTHKCNSLRVRDNVFVERLWRSVKYQEVYLRAYESVGEAGNSIGRYLDFYNGRRPHQSLDDATPDQAYFNQPPFRLAA